MMDFENTVRETSKNRLIARKTILKNAKVTPTPWKCYYQLKKKTKIFIKVQGDISEPNHLRCAKELTAPTDPRQHAWGLNRGVL